MNSLLRECILYDTMTEKVSNSLEKAPIQNTEQDSLIERIKSLIGPNMWSKQTAFVDICKKKDGLFKLSYTFGSAHIPPLHICQSMIKAASKEGNGLRLFLIMVVKMTKQQIEKWEGRKKGSHTELVQTIMKQKNLEPERIKSFLIAHIEKQGHDQLIPILGLQTSTFSEKVEMSDVEVRGIFAEENLNAFIENDEDQVISMCAEGKWEELKSKLQSPSFLEKIDVTVVANRLCDKGLFLEFQQFNELHRRCKLKRPGNAIAPYPKRVKKIP